MLCSQSVVVLQYCKIFPQLTDPSRTASTRKSDTMQTWTIQVEQQPSPVSMSFFQSKTLWVKVPYFSFSEGLSHKVKCTVGFMAFLGLLGCKRVTQITFQWQDWLPLWGLHLHNTSCWHRILLSCTVLFSNHSQQGYIMVQGLKCPAGTLQRTAQGGRM